MEKLEPPGITVRIRGFQDPRGGTETCVIHQEFEGRQADLSPANLGVAVHPGPTAAQAVVQVKTPDPPLAKPPDAFVHHRGRSALGGQVVSRAEEVAGVQADADPPGRVHREEDLLQLLQSVPEAVALASGHLEADLGHEPRERAVHLVQGAGHEPEAPVPRGM